MASWTTFYCPHCDWQSASGKSRLVREEGAPYIRCPKCLHVLDCRKYRHEWMLADGFERWVWASQITFESLAIFGGASFLAFSWSGYSFECSCVLAAIITLAVIAWQIIRIASRSRERLCNSTYLMDLSQNGCFKDQQHFDRVVSQLRSTKITVSCPECGRNLYGARRSMIGDTGSCRNCNAEFEIKV
jgi:transcription elongation factor Elf1